jgi:hypothetical protein
MSYSTIILLLTVTLLYSHSIQISTTMWDSLSINPSIHQVIAYSQTVQVFRCDLSHLILRFCCDNVFASMNVWLKCLIEWENSRHAFSTCFWLHRIIKQAGYLGMICSVSQDAVHHRLEHAIMFLKSQLLAIVTNAELNEFTMSEVITLTSTTIEETSWVIRQTMGHIGSIIIWRQKKSIFNCVI